MQAELQTWKNEEWVTTATVTTDPTVVTVDGAELTGDALAQWAANQPTVITKQGKVSVLSHTEAWLTQKAKYNSTYTRVNILEG